MMASQLTKNFRMYYSACGDGPPVILLHGLAASHHDWDWLAPELATSGFKALCPDLIGHGNSEKPDLPEEYSVENLYDAIDHWTDAIGVERPYNLIGHSLGGYLSLLLALQKPTEISRLVLVSPFYSPNQLFSLARQALAYPNLSEMAISLVNSRLVNSVLGLVKPLAGEYPPQARWQTAMDYKRTAPSSMRFPASAQDLSTRVGEIETPTLVVWGQSDLLLNPSSFPNLVNSLPNARGIPIPGCGHEPQKVSTRKFNLEVLQFLTHIG